MTELDSAMQRSDWDSFWEDVDFAAYILSLTYHDRLLLRKLSSLLTGTNPARLLELGCACSKMLYRLPAQTDSGIEFYGLDPSIDVLIASSGLYDPDRAALAAGDLFASPFAPGSFGLVASFGLIEHYRDPQPFLGKCLDLLAPGGLLIAGYPSYQGLTGWLQRRVNPSAFDHHFSLPAADMGREFSRAGLVDVRSEYFGLFNPNMIDWGRGKFRRALMYGCFALVRPVEWLAAAAGFLSMPGALSSYVMARGRKPGRRDDPGA